MAKLDMSRRSEIEKQINGALRSCIHDHGPITREISPSAAKRVIGALKSLAREMDKDSKSGGPR